MANEDALMETVNIALTNGSDWLSVQDRDRAYTSQPHTYHGERGKTLLNGITYRDVFDCFVIGMFLASDTPEDERGSIYALDVQNIDLVAAAQCMSCELEKRQGIYPNVPKLEFESSQEDK